MEKGSRVVRLEIESTEKTPKRIYEFNPRAVFETNGQTYEFISFKKIQIDRNGAKKFQNLTVSKDNWLAFVGFLQEVLEDVERNIDDDVPF